MPDTQSHARMIGRLRRPLQIALTALLWMAPGSVALAQSVTEIVRGRVVGPDSLPVAGADVLVTGLETRNGVRTTTDENGAWTVVFANPEGDYLVAIRRIGYRSTSLRLSRIGISTMLFAETQLMRTSGMLDTVLITSNDDTTSAQRAIGEVGSSALAEQLFLADPSNLAALLLSIPGVGFLDDSTYSVLGASSSQNSQTLDGSQFGGTEVPADALATARGITDSADPAKGGFAGGSVATTLRGGTDIFRATVRGDATNPSLAWNDPAWTRPIQSRIDQSGTADGPIRKGVLRYKVSWRARQSATDWWTLGAPRAEVLAQQGITLDTVAAVNDALATLGVPTTSPRIPHDLSTRNLSATTVLDLTLSATSSVRLTHSGNWSDGVSGSSSATAYPTRANASGRSSNFIAMKASGLVRGFLNELTTSVNTSRNHSDPYLAIPSASVRVGTDFGGGRTGFTNLSFGAGSGNSYERSTGVEVIDELSWLPKSGKHKLKVGGRWAYDANSQFDFSGNPLLGRYTYQTLADLQANRPATYERLLGAAPRTTKAQNRSAWVGDEWMVSRSLQIQTGLRLDFADPVTKPAYNARADSVFGIRTDRIPDDVGLSPRIGFSWTSARRRGRGTAGNTASLGGISAAALASMPPELVRSMLAMQRGSSLPGIAISGTIGAYRGVTRTSTIAQYVDATGVGSRVELNCFGDAVPIPDWNSLSDGPTTCADGTTATSHAIASPEVRVFDPSFRAPTSWRTNVKVDGIRGPRGWLIVLNAAASYNVEGQSGIDINLNPTPKFQLESEADRPVYVNAATIVPSTGAISSAASRVSPDFLTVTRAISDLRGYNAQLRASVSPPRPLFNNRLRLDFSYSLNLGASEQRGDSWAGITGDPFTKEWVKNPDPLHSIRATANARVGWFNFGLSASLYSGRRFAPWVQGDVNGDGRSSNDRAFIPDPSTTADTSLARQMTELLAHAPGAARACLVKQLGKMAGANSCRTPWQFRADVSASLAPPSRWRYSDRLRLTFNTQNASGGLVRLLGLENTPLGQSTLSTSVIPTLLYVRGFDQDAQRFQYSVNQSFGQPTNFGSLRRRFAPLQMQVGLEYVFGGPMINPVARAMGFREPEGAPALSAAEQRAAVARLKRDPAAKALQAKDSLALTAEQVTQFEALSNEYDKRADNALTSLENWIIRKGKRVADDQLSPKLRDAQAALAKLNTEFGKKVRELMTAEQAARFGSR